MPYLLKQLPSDQDIKKFSNRFSNLDPSLLKAPLLLLKAGAGLEKTVESYFEKYNLSYARYAILFLLLRLEPRAVKQTELARKLEVSRASVTGFLNSLENDGLITRRPCPNDKRAFNLELTKSGRAIVENLLPGHIENLVNFLAHLKREERTLLENLLEKLLIPPKPQPTRPARKKGKASKKK